MTTSAPDLAAGYASCRREHQQAISEGEANNVCVCGCPGGFASWASQGACLDSDPGLFFPITASGPAP